MTFEPEISEDCLLVDGVETVTLHGTTTVSVVGAKRGRLTQGDLELGALGLEPNDLAWNLPELNLEGVAPRAGNRIEEANGTQWIILCATRAPLTAVWRTLCRRQR